MTRPTEEIVLVTPVWNDTQRLARFGPELAKTLALAGLPVEWIIADDGSSTAEVDRLHSLAATFQTVYQRVRVHVSPQHLGKGGVVRQTWNECHNASWLAFLDADGSVNGTDWLRLMHQALATQDSVLGIRKRTATTQLKETWFRSLCHRGFLRLADGILGLQSADPQCGAKIMHGDDYRRAMPFLRENGLAFDSELLAVIRAQGSRWQEIPVNWHESPGGKVRPLFDAWGMFAALLRIRHRVARLRLAHVTNQG